MAAFKTASPSPPTGNAEADIQSLYTTLYSLIFELRTLLHSLDAQNVLRAKTVRADGIMGTISADKLPDTVHELSISGSIHITDSDGTKLGTISADNAGNVTIDTAGEFVVNGTALL